nr:wax ester/triacylglycerol synthase family O-acyltransferase [Burkholderiales bacterium]
MDQLSAQDSQFLYLETETNYTHVTYVAVYDPSTSRTARFDFEAILELVESRLHISPIFQRKLKRVPLDLDYPYWVDDEYFDFESHVVYTRLPEPGTWAQFRRHIARYHSRPLDMNRPLWEMYVVEGLDAIDDYPTGAFAVATKVHHAAVDGAAAMRFFVALSDVDAKGTPAISLDRPAQFSGGGPSLLGMASRALVSHV